MWTAALIYSLVQVYDGVMTAIGLHYTTIPEGNPLVVWIMEGLGIIGGLLVWKIALVVIVVGSSYIYRRAHRLLPVLLLYIGAGITLLLSSMWWYPIIRST